MIGTQETHIATLREREALEGGFNLSDAHPRWLAPEEEAIVDRLGDIFKTAINRPQSEVEAEYVAAFFARAHQTGYQRFKEPLLHFTSSMAYGVVASALHSQAGVNTIAFIDPTFDCLRGQFRNHGIKTTVLPEDVVFSEGVSLETHEPALFVEIPNNPTGREMSERRFRQIVDYCVKMNTLLILDVTFRFYSNLHTFDQYDILYDSGVNFVAVEDTGKTYPTDETKIGMMVASDALHGLVKSVLHDEILATPRSVLQLLTEFIRHDNRERPRALAVAQNHRKILWEHLSGTPLKPFNPDSKLSIEWVELPEYWGKASEFTDWLKARSVHILPGHTFFAEDKAKGDRYVRIAMYRPPDMFIKAAQKLGELTKMYDQLKVHSL